MSTIGRAIRAYYPNPYPNELVILYSGEQSAALTAETSAWRQAARGPLKIAEIAPTNSSMIREHLPPNLAGRPEVGARLSQVLLETPSFAHD